MTGRVDRPSGRVLVVDETGSVLLFRIVDPLDTKPPVWITPGGGLEAGESLAEGAARELEEETGLRVEPAALRTPVAVCRGYWEFRGRPLYSEDWFFATRTRRFDPSPAGWTVLEHELHERWHWWTPDELDRAEEAFLPCGLADLVRRIVRGELPPDPIELPWRVV
jgi:8-oxo-dGTP pyrophosphatase MutT (NUDIX family)